MRPLCKNNQGNAILAVVMATAIIAIGYNSIIGSVVRYKAKVMSFKGDVDIRLSLHSTLDFVLFGVKQQYCFDDVLMQDANCDLKHPASVERLIMTTDQLNYIKSMIANGAITNIADPNALPLSSISKKINFSTVSILHPLYVIFKSEKLKSIATGVEVILERDNSLYVPKYGGEIYLNVTVKFYGLKDEANKLNLDKLVLKSKISIHPREVGSFALMIAKDLRLDKTNLEIPALAAGDVGFHQFTGSAASLAKGYKGINFLSPVFVNNDIHLPNSMAEHFTAVTFSDKVYMGNGSVMKNGVPFKPISTGGLSDRYWNGRVENFGGFLKGVENDGGVDKGLSVLGKAAPGVIADYGLMQKCIARTQGNINNNILLNNALSASPRKFDRSNSPYLWSVQRLTISNGDEFNYQSKDLTDSASKTWNTPQSSFYRKTTTNPGTLVNATVQLLSTNPMNNLEINFDMSTDYQDASNDEYVELKTDFAKLYADLLKTQLDSANADLSAAKAVLKTAQDEKAALMASAPSAAELAAASQAVSDAEIALQVAKDEKVALLAKDPPATAGQIDDANLKITNAENSLQTAKDNLASLQAKVPTTSEIAAADKKISDAQIAVNAAEAIKTDFNTKYTAAKYMDDNPPIIKVYLNKVYEGDNANNDQEKNKIDFNMVLKNEKSLVDVVGKPYNLSIKTKGFNLGYSNGKSNLKDDDGNSKENLNLEGYLNFPINNVNKLTEPLALSPSNSAPASVATPEDMTDYSNLDAQCEAQRDAQSSQSFGSAGYFYDFSPTTRASWNFAGGSVFGVDPLLASIVFDGTNASTPANASFQVRSIVGQCTIKSTAVFVSGFFACDKLTIEARSLPLKIIGTFIVGKLSIDASAYSSGIIWSSIYHPQATLELRKMRILEPLPGGPVLENCSSFGANNKNNPIWHPIPSVQYYTNRESCNVISLREKADPFRWTSVDPDCGLVPGNSNTVCKHKLNRFHIYEHSRGESD